MSAARAARRVLVEVIGSPPLCAAGEGVVLAARGSLCAVVALLVLVVGTVVGCGGDSDAEEGDRPATSATEALANPTVDGRFEVAADGRRLYLTCWGEGSPTVVLDSGHPDGTGITDFGHTEFVRRLVAETRVCAYDRAGWGRSDPAPNEPRSADEVVDDLDALLKAAEVEDRSYSRAPR